MKINSENLEFISSRNQYSGKQYYFRYETYLLTISVLENHPDFTRFEFISNQHAIEKILNPVFTVIKKNENISDIKEILDNIIIILNLNEEFINDTISSYITKHDRYIRKTKIKSILDYGYNK
jgi:hypothetical protein